MGELGVELILAHSPQAKGRVERRNAVFQDRLVKALRLKQISDLESANQFLEEEFLEELNARFTVQAAKPTDLHRRVRRGVKLERVLSFQEQRVVQNDWTVRWQNRWFQLTAENRKLSLVKRKVTVCESLDGKILLLLGRRELSWEELPERSVKPQKERKAKKTKPVKSPRTAKRGRHKPSASHPWRQYKDKASENSPAVRSTARRTSAESSEE